MATTDPSTGTSDAPVVTQRLTTMKHVVATGADYSCLHCGATVYERDLYMALLEGHEQVSRFTVRDFTVRCESHIKDAAVRPEFKIKPPAEDSEVYLETGSLAETTRIDDDLVGNIRDKIRLPFEDCLATEHDEWYRSEDAPVYVVHDPDAPADGEIPTEIEAPEDDRWTGTTDEEWEPPAPKPGLWTTLDHAVHGVLIIPRRIRALTPVDVGFGGVLVLSIIVAYLTWGLFAATTVLSLSIALATIYHYASG